MIFFALDQVAGAEYVLPFLLDPACRAAARWKIFAAQPASTVLTRHGIDFDLVLEPDLNATATLFAEHRPSKCIASTSSESKLERAFIRAAKASHVPSAQLIDTWVNYAERFRVAGETLYPDRILTLDEPARARMIREGIPADLIRIIGQPYLEFTLARQTSGGSRSRMLLVSQPIDRYYQKTLGYDQWDFLAACLEAARLSGGDASAIDVNVHPAEDLAAYERFLAAGGSAATAMKRADLAYGDYAHFLGMFSSVLLQGVLHGVATASVQPGAVGPDKCTLSENGLIPRFTDVASLAEYLRRPAAAPDASRLQRVVLGSTARLKRFILDELGAEGVP